MQIYTIVRTAIDEDRGFLPDPAIEGSYCSRTRALTNLERLIKAEKEELDERYNCENRGEDFWEMYSDGYYSSLFSRIEVLASELEMEVD